MCIFVSPSIPSLGGDPDMGEGEREWRSPDLVRHVDFLLSKPAAAALCVCVAAGILSVFVHGSYAPPLCSPHYGYYTI